MKQTSQILKDAQGCTSRHKPRGEWFVGEVLVSLGPLDCTDLWNFFTLSLSTRKALHCVLNTKSGCLDNCRTSLSLRLESPVLLLILPLISAGQDLRMCHLPDMKSERGFTVLPDVHIELYDAKNQCRSGLLHSRILVPT